MTKWERSARKKLERATAKILAELGINETSQIPIAEVKEDNDKQGTQFIVTNEDPKKMFTINTTANGIAVTGDDKHNAIYLPKVALPELVKALMDFI